MAAAQVVLKMEGRGVLQDLIPDVGQLELAHVPIGGCILDPDVHGLHGSGSTLCFPTHYVEIVHTDAIISGVTTAIDGEGALRCSLSLFPEVLVTSPMYSYSQSA